MKYGVHIKFLSWIKNSSKTWEIAVDLTEVSSLTVSTRTGKNYNISTNYHISAILGGVADGHDDAELLKEKDFQNRRTFGSHLIYK